MKIYMIRHGATKGNKERRYVGITDESLLQEAREFLAKKRLPPVARVYASPRKRCMETAAVLYPDCQPIVKKSLAECDFGDFEYCNYEELNGNSFYQKFIDSMGRSAFPKGEDRDTFQRRVVNGFLEIMEAERFHKKEDIAFVVHGGTIMSILDFCQNTKTRSALFCKIKSYNEMGDALYYKWQVGNGEGYVADVIWEEAGNGFYLENLRRI